MGSLLIRGLSDATVRKLKVLAAKAGLSVNRYLVSKIEQETGGGTKRRQVHHDLDHLLGTMSKRDYDALEESVEEQRSIDPELWS